MTDDKTQEGVDFTRQVFHGAHTLSSQALKTEEALLSCMTYVDLNPVRAGMASSPETSHHTSIQERMNPSFDMNQAIDDQRQCGDLMDFKAPLQPLLRFEGGLSNELQAGILFSFRDYLELVDWTGRITRKDKRSYIDNALPPILHRL